MQLTAEREVTALQERYLDAVHDELRRVVPRADAEREGDVHTLLRYHLGWEEADGNSVIGNGGKALRPLLCLMACELAGGEWRQALPAAASLELIHNFSLIHDDIQDRDAIRRGRATTWSIWGIPKAVTAGNAMRVLADQSLLALADLNVPAPTAVTASLMLTARYMEMIEGQYLDMAFEESDQVTTNGYLDMISRKTGSLIESAMFVGALVATGELRVAGAFGRCGRLLGQAFQVQDDYLGIWGDPAKVGKPVGADIRRKKKSLPVVHVFQEAKGQDRERLRQIYAAPQVEGSEVEEVMVMMGDAETPAYVWKTAEAQSHAALEPLEGLDLPSAARQRVQAVAEYFVSRER